MSKQRVRKIEVEVTVAGSAGSATGSAQTSTPLSGRVLAVHLDYTTQAATADVTVKALEPDLAILTVTNANTDAWFYPRTQIQDAAGVGVTFDGTNEVYEAVPVDGYIEVSVAQSNAGTVVATLLVEE